MTKQIKVGFDKVPTPSAEQEELLYDVVSATPLTNNARQRLTTTEVQPVAEFGAAKNSASTVINNKNIVGQGGSLPVAEVFPEFSEVSSTLLGVARAEEQLSLFSDVSSYGLDEENWEIVVDNRGIPESPAEWENRQHPLFGKRRSGGMFEQTREQALELSTFPVQYSYPYGPEFERTGQYDPTFYPQYINFIAAGKILYNHYHTNGYEDFADKNFIKPNIKLVDVDGIEQSEYFVTTEGQFLGLGDVYKVDYSTATSSIEETFNQVENFTLMWQSIVNETTVWPDAGFQSQEETVELLTNLRTAQEQVRPGYYTNTAPTVRLQSKKVFRYQPGRISGFTFGSRNRVDPGSSAASVEWGITNDTDEYIFRVQGANFSVIRRSTVPLSTDLLERMGLAETDQTTLSKQLDRGPASPFYETIISRDKFNKDTLLGNGPSGYVISFEQVTMYKIEFGWYGAIGAKFYAYIPVGNDECRWVLLHHLVIENGIDKPCLEDPNFRFTYRLDVESTATLTEPLYIYKYGSSCYIDGGDEGTLQVYSARSERKGFTDDSPLLGILPKDAITSSVGIPKANNKKVYPESVSLTSSAEAQLKIVSIPTSPEGMHTHFSPSLISGVSNRSREVDLSIAPDGETVTIVSASDTFTDDDYDAHLIGDGLYNVYVDPTSATGATIIRRSDFDIVERPVSRYTFSYDTGTIVEQHGRTVNNVRLSNLNTYVASTFPITSNLFKIHFLNPTMYEASGQVANFAIGFTKHQPKLVPRATVDTETWETANQLLRFGDNSELLNIRNLPHAIYSNAQEFNDPFNGNESSEYNYIQDRFVLDYELDNIDNSEPGVVDGGRVCAALVQIELENFIFSEVEQLTANTYRIKFTSEASAPSISQNDVDTYDIEIGVNNNASGVILVSPLVTEQVGVDGFGQPIYNYYFDVDTTNEISNYFDQIVSSKSLQIKSIRILENTYVSTRNENGEIETVANDMVPPIRAGFNVLPLYPVFALGDNARINNIVVEEYTPTGSRTHTPQFISSDISYDTQGNPVTSIENTGGSSLAFRPANFQSNSLGTSVLIDEDIEQPLRPGELVFSSYVNRGKTSKIDLDKIFAPDRKTIQRSDIDSRAYFFTLSRIKSGTPSSPSYTVAGDAEMSITLKEQL